MSNVLSQTVGVSRRSHFDRAVVFVNCRRLGWRLALAVVMACAGAAPMAAAAGPAIPLNPNLALTPAGQVLVTWGDASTNETGFLVRRVDTAAQAVSDYTLVANATVFLDVAVIAGRNYCYYIQAFGTTGVSNFTAAKCITVSVPAMPSNPNAVLRAGGQILFTWQDTATNETGFLVRRLDTATQAIVEIPLPANTVQYLATTTQFGKNYCYEVQAFNGMGASSFTSPKCVLVSSPAIPSNPNLTLRPGGQVLFTWEDDSTNETDFLIRRVDTASQAVVDFIAAANATLYLDTTAVGGKNYCYSVQARNVLGSSNFTAARCVLVSAPAIPADPNVSLRSDGKVLVTWTDASTNETGFRIRRLDSVTQATTDFTVTADEAQYIDTTIVAGRNYCYYIQAFNTIGVSDFTSAECILVGVPTMPLNAAVALRPSGQVLVTWADASTNETGFLVRRVETSTQAITDVTVAADAIQHLDTTAVAGKHYCYHVQALNALGASDFTSAKCILVSPPAMPSNLQLELRPGGYVLLRWVDVSTNETGFLVRRVDSITQAAVDFAAAVDATEHQDTTAVSGRNYCYYVQALNAMGASSFTPAMCVTVGAPASPSNPNLTLQPGGHVLFTWQDTSTNETGFVVRRIDNANQATVDFTTAANTSQYLDTAVMPSRSYSYYVQARNAMGVSNFSSAVSMQVGVPATPSNPSVGLLPGGQARFTWVDTSTNETGFRVRRVDAATQATVDFTTAANTAQYLDSTVAAGRNYWYSVQAFNLMGASSFTVSTYTVIGVPAMPTSPNLVLRPGGQILFTWVDASTNETSFLVRRQDIVSKAVTEVSQPANSTQYLDLTVESGKSYAYWVQSRNEIGTSRFTARQSMMVSPPAMPLNPTVLQVAGGQVLFTWVDASTNETDFRVFRQDSITLATADSLCGAGVTQYLDTSVEAGKRYCYYVQARNAMGVSDFNSSVCIQVGIPATPSNPSVGLLPGGQIQFTWVDASTNETGFRVRREDSAGGSIKEITFADSSQDGLASPQTGNSYSYTDTTVESGQSYCYRVQAVNETGTSDFTSPKCLLVGVPTTPSNPNVVLKPGSQILFTWADTSPNETGFLVRRQDTATQTIVEFVRAANSTQYVDTTVQVGREYCYSVQAYNQMGDSGLTSPQCMLVGAPAPPLAPVLTRVPGGYLLFTWQDVSTNETDFHLRRQDMDTQQTMSVTLPADSTDYLDPTIEIGKRYCYYVQARNPMGVSNFTQYACVEVTPPAVPLNPRVTLMSTGKTLVAWSDASSDETGFRVRREETASGSIMEFTRPANATAYFDNSTEPGKNYCYTVQAFDDVGASDFTVPQCITISPPSIPLDPRVALTVLGKGVLFTWKDTSTNEAEFQVRREEVGIGAIEYFTLAANTTCYHDTTVETGKNYCYSIQSRNPMGSSAFSPSVCITVALGDPGVVAGAYYVAPNGSTGNNGSRGSPWPSVEYALSRVGGGKTIILRPGEYPPITIGSQFSGTTAAPTVIKSEFKWQAIIRGGTYVSSEYLGTGVLLANGAPPNRTRWVVLDGLQVCHNEGDGIMVQGDRNTVRNCWVHHNGDTNRDDSFGRSGIGSYGFADNTIEQCLIEWNGRSWKDALLDHGIYAYGIRYAIRNNIIRYNRAYGINVGSSSEIIGANDFLIYGNVCHSQSVAGGMLVKYGPGGQHVGQTLLDPTLPPNRLYHNTCWGNAHDGITVYGEISNTPTEVMNNTCVGDTGYSLSVGADPRRPPIKFNVVYDYNLVSSVRPKGIWYTDRPEAWGPRNQTLGAWPFFADTDFGLLAEDSPARQIGATQYLVPIDLFGRPRADNPPDAGAVPFEGNNGAPLHKWIP